MKLIGHVSHNERLLSHNKKVTAAPVDARFNETLVGVATVRAFDGAVARLFAQFGARVDQTNRAELAL